MTNRKPKTKHLGVVHRNQRVCGVGRVALGQFYGPSYRYDDRLPLRGVPMPSLKAQLDAYLGSFEHRAYRNGWNHKPMYFRDVEREISNEGAQEERTDE